MQKEINRVMRDKAISDIEFAYFFTFYTCKSRNYLLDK